MPHDGHKKTAGVIALPPLIYLAGVLNGGFLQIIYPITFLPSWELQLLSILFFGIGFYLAASARKRMVKAGTNVNPMEPTLALVQDGPYRFTRNPMYVGLTLGQLSLATAFNSLWMLLMMLPVLVVMHYGVILREERYLESLFGAQYLEYKSRVRRWL